MDLQLVRIMHVLNRASVISTTFTSDNALASKTAAFANKPEIRTQRSRERKNAIQSPSIYDPNIFCHPSISPNGKPLLATSLTFKKMRLYVPPERWNEEQDHDNIKTYHPRRLFVLAPCNICGIPECGKEEDGHGSPIVIAISGVKHRSTSACAVFCNINSAYNKTTLLHKPNYSVPQVELKAAVLALEQVKAFIATEATDEAIIQTRQIIIKTDSIYITADKKTRSRLKKCKHLIREFNELLV